MSTYPSVSNQHRKREVGSSDRRRDVDDKNTLEVVVKNAGNIWMRTQDRCAGPEEMSPEENGPYSF